MTKRFLMNKFLFLTCLLLILYNNRVYPQDKLGRSMQKVLYGDRIRFQHDQSLGNNSLENFKMNSLFMELGGNGILLTMNYERYLRQQIGVRLGYGGIYGIGTTIPIMLNYYFG